VEDYPKRIPDLLESATDKVRSLTVDRIARALTYAALALVIVTLMVIGVIFLLVGLFRIGDELIAKACDCGSSVEITYAALGGLLLLVGVVLWFRRNGRRVPGKPRR
jgi:uncharacterized BrkB/YihY/UPF0761 family membrane protein